MVTYSTGRQTQYIAIDFHFRRLAASPSPADGENTEARWFPIDDLPAKSDWHRATVDRRWPRGGRVLRG
jgi:hypothetical protein